MWPSNGGQDESQNWTREQHQWSALKSHYYLSLPHESVDWAQLAKQWIQMNQNSQQMPQMPSLSAPLPPLPSLPPQPTHPIGPHFVPIGSHVTHSTHPNVIQEDISRPVYQTPIETNDWIRGPPPPPPPPSRPPPSGPPLLPTPHHSVNFQSYSWTQQPVQQIQTPIVTTNEVVKGKQQMNQLMSLDAAKKKNLPNWLREGLEKMEKDKVKKIEKEKEEHQRMERIKAIRDKEQELRREIEMEHKIRSHYDSSEDNDSRDEEVNDDENEVEDKVQLSEEEMVSLSLNYIIIVVIITGHYRC
jgi:arginine/serine-rich splicing factor 18